ncbi:MAG: zf-HC2 domain-containing protein [Gemmatimonadota bacterium]
MTDQWMHRLSEYLDGELTPVERSGVEDHLSTCETCRRVLDELRIVMAQAAVLPDREPQADLWPGVREAIAQGRVVPISAARPARRFSFSLAQLTAAAAALVLVSASAVWFTVARGPDGVAAMRTDSATVRSVSFDPRGRADSAITELERILAQEHGRLDSTTVRILAQNLALIDRAIEQARKALESDPGNAYLNDHLAKTMRKKIDVLRRAAALAAVAS